MCNFCIAVVRNVVNHCRHRWCSQDVDQNLKLMKIFSDYRDYINIIVIKMDLSMICVVTSF